MTSWDSVLAGGLSIKKTESYYYVRIAIININKAWKSSKKYILVDFGPWDYKPKIIFEKYYK